MNNKLVNIRLVLASDEGGIRQSERQYIPALKAQGVNVIGIVLGDSYGNYKDQKSDFQFLFKNTLANYKGSILIRVVGLIKNMSRSKRLAQHIYSSIQSQVKDAQVVINVRRVNLIPLSLKVAKILEADVVFHSGGSFRKGPLAINKLAYWYLKKLPRLRILANSKYSASSYGLRAENYVYPGYAPERLTPTGRNIRGELQAPTDVPVFLYMARVNWDKAPDLLIKAFLSSKLASNLNAHLIIAGPVQDGSLDNKLKGLVHSHSEANTRVHLVGKQLDIGNWFSASDIFVNSRRGVEPFGISIVEAMASGLPVVSSGLGGPTETVREGVNGWLVKDLSVRGYRNAIETALKEKSRWHQFGKASLKLSEKYTSQSQIQRYIAICYTSSPYD